MLHLIKKILITIPFSTEGILSDYPNKENQYKAILKLFSKFEIDYHKTDETNKIVNEIDNENKDFLEFSKKAKNIRNNIHEGDDFKNFSNIVEKTI